MNTKYRRTMLTGVVALSLVAAGCGSDGGDDAADTTAATGGAGEATTEGDGGAMTDVSGDVIVSGSSTVEPISIRVGELISERTDGAVAVTVDGPGTGDGFKLFCAGETDISDASRQIKDEEAATCAENGIEYTEIAVAIDGLTVATSPTNTAVECLDIPALYALLGPESEGLDSWSGAAPLAAELGSAYADVLPDADLLIAAPGEESGTYDTFVEFAIAELAESRGEQDWLRADYAASPNDNLIVEGIEGSDTSLGFVGYAYYASQGDKMRAIAIDDGGSCVSPTSETIADGSYPFSRTLYIYVNNANAAENPAVKAYVDLYVSDDGFAQAAKAGYVTLPAEEMQASADAWTAMG